MQRGTPVTRKVLERKFKAFIEEVLKGEVAESGMDHGKYYLDYCKYKGYMIHRISMTSTGVQCPFGHERHRPGVLWNMMDFAITISRGV